MNTLGGIFIFSFISCTSQFLVTINVPPSETNVYEGHSKVFTVQHPPVGPCSISLKQSVSTADNNDFVLTGFIDSTQINTDLYQTVTGQTATFTLSVLVDGDGPETLTLETKCSVFEDQITFNVLPNAGLNMDPHFSQHISNTLTKETTRICYDISTEKNQFIHIFSHQKYGIHFFGQLKDDYYMHKIILQIDNQIIQADIDYISFFTDKYALKWDNIVNDDWFEFHGIHFRQYKDTIEVKRRKNDDFSFGIIRRKDQLGKYYLDVLLKGLSTDYTGMDGLLGRIGTNKIEIYPQIQESNVNSLKTVVINGYKTVGYGKIRGTVRCTFVKVDDLLYPKKLDNYIHKSIYMMNN